MFLYPRVYDFFKFVTFASFCAPSSMKFPRVDCPNEPQHYWLECVQYHSEVQQRTVMYSNILLLILLQLAYTND